MEIPYELEVRPDTGLTNGKLGIWLFLASEVMLFGALFASLLLLLPAEGWSQTSTRTAPGQLTTEEDGSPDLRCRKYKFADGNVTDNGDGTCSIADGGGGDSVTVNSTAVDTTANFLDNAIIEFDIADGGAGGPGK